MSAHPAPGGGEPAKPPGALPAAGFPRSEAAFAFCASLFVVTLVLTNVIGTKLFEVTVAGEAYTLTSGILTYPITFLLTDLVSEIWGRTRANAMVVWGFLMSLLMLGVLNLAIVLTPSGGWGVPTAFEADVANMQSAFAATFANPGVLLLASMLAYLVAQLLDVRLYHFWWRVTGGRHMWVRNNGSTAISQLVDTTIVIGIYFSFGQGFGPENGWTLVPIAKVILTVYVFKLCLAVLDTPLIYAARIWMERFLGIAHDPARQRAPLA